MNLEKALQEEMRALHINTKDVWIEVRKKLPEERLLDAIGDGNDIKNQLN
jgi:hypothetical protein